MRRLSLVLLSVVIGLFTVGCDATGPSLESGPGTLELRMTGASSSHALTSASAVVNSTDSSTTRNVDSASVTITRAAIVTKGDSAQGDSSESAGTGIQVLSEEDFVVDLIDLQSGLDTLMTKVDLEQGTYAQLRLITADQATVVFEDGTKEDVMVASGQQTGFKVNFEPFTIDSPQDEVELTLQFDVQESLHGNAHGRFVITPAIDATVNVNGSGG